MSTRPVPRHTSDPDPHPVPAPPTGHPPQDPTDVATRLVDLGVTLADIVRAAPGPPDLVGVVDAAELDHDDGGTVEGTRPDALVFAALPGPDPVASIVGVVAPPSWWAVGLVSSAQARHLDGAPLGEIAFVHLVARDGTSVGVLGDPDGTTHVDGPHRVPQIGRVPDLCRRALGLPTAPPACGMAPHLVDLWLHRLAEAADDDPGLSWSEVAALHPAAVLADATPEPADLVRATGALAAELDWERYRRVCAARDGVPTSGLDVIGAAWFDAGSFSRWLLGEAPPWSVELERLDALLRPSVADRVFATVRLSPGRGPAPTDPEP